MDKEVTRRAALKLAAGAAALGAALGVPRSALAMAARGAYGEKIFFKFYYSGKVWHTMELTEEQSKQLGDNPGALSIKLFRSSATESVGAVSLTPEMQLKIRALYKMSR